MATVRGISDRFNTTVIHEDDALADSTGVDFTVGTNGRSLMFLVTCGIVASGTIDFRIMHGAAGSPTTRVPDADLDFPAASITTNVVGDVEFSTTNDSFAVLIGYHGNQVEVRLELLNASTPVGEFSATAIEGDLRRTVNTP